MRQQKFRAFQSFLLHNREGERTFALCRTTRFTCERLLAMSGATASFSARGRLRAENAAFQPRETGAAT